MRVADIRSEPSPLLDDATRISAQVRAASEPPERVFFDVPAHLDAPGAERGDAWAAAMLPLAMQLREPLEVDAPVDAQLLEGLGRWSRIYALWYPALRPVRVQPVSVERRLPADREPLASFFSGGVDSWYNVVRNPVSALVTVWGFDIPLAHDAAFGRLSRALEEVAAELGCEPVRIATNLRQTAWRRVPWGPLGHGAALAACAHLLAGRFGGVLLGSSLGCRQLAPWGSHPLTDPLLSSASLEIRHFGDDVTRVAKTEALADEPAARRLLRVCYAHADERNCGHCTKCLRTRITLEMAGVLGDFKGFPGPPVDLGELARAHHRPEARIFFDEIAARAREKGRHDVARAAERAIARSARRNRLRGAVEQLREVPLAWRLHRPLQRWLTANREPKR